MAKAISLSDDILTEPAATPRAAQSPPRAAPIAAATPPAKAKKAPMVPLQIRVTAADAKAIRRAAVEAETTISDFMLACVNAYMKK